MENVIEAWKRGETLAEVQGIPVEIGDAISALAEAELEAGRVETARALLEGLVVTNHRDAVAWALLSQAHRRLGAPHAARFCAEVGARLAPEEGFVRLARAESLLASAETRDEGRAVLRELAPDEEVGARARALLAALGQ
jgi:predicted Zn-dependent protease